MATQLDKWGNWPGGREDLGSPCQFLLSEPGRCVPWRDRKEHLGHLATCLPLLSSVTLRVTCQEATGFWDLEAILRGSTTWVNDVWTPSFQEEQMQAGKGVAGLISHPLASVGAVCSLSALDSSCPSWREHREKNPQRRRNGWMDSAQKDSCIFYWGKSQERAGTLSVS